MMDRANFIAAAVLICVITALCALTSHYKRAYTEQQAESESLRDELNNANAALKTQQEQQRRVAALDARYTQELVNAKQENDRMRADIANGRYRVYVKAKCPVSETSTTSGASNAASAQLDRAATEHLLVLRERIATATTQIKGLQDYIRTQCR